jgi:hypothetical protein
MKILFIFFSFLHLTACSTLHLNDFSSIEEIQTLSDTNTSTLPAYDLTGGIWLKNQPLFINKEFNFGAAMAIEGVGAAIAVGMRNKKNTELVEQLSQLPPLQLNERFHKKSDKYLLKNTGKQQIAIYGILYGQPSAHLRTIIETYSPTTDAKDNDGEHKQNVQRYVHYSNWMPISGEGSWSENNSSLLWNYFDESMVQLIDVINRDLLLETNGIKRQEVNYSINGGESFQRGKGFIIDKQADITIIQSTTIPDTLLIIQNNDLKIQSD